MKHNQTQPLFPDDDPRHIREREMVKLRALREELREKARANEHKRRIIEKAERSESWSEWKAYCVRLK